MKNTFLFFTVAAFTCFVQCTAKYDQPGLEAKNSQIIKIGSYRFKDLNKNGQLDPYEDWRLPVGERAENLISLMTIEEKVGLMFHPNMAVPVDGKIVYDLTGEELRKTVTTQGGFPGQPSQPATAKSYIEEKNFRFILNNGVSEPKLFAEWSNGIQEIAEASRLGIPVIFSSDPRHGVTAGRQGLNQYFSQWPGYLGISATRDLDLIRLFGEIVAEEFRAVGLHMMLGPQIDLPTDPRWSRSSSSFSESAELTAEQLAAFMDGAQDSLAGPDKIILNLKHFPGGGPVDNGNAEWLVYPGDNFNYHLIPWKEGIKKGALLITDFYVGSYFDTLGVSYSKYINTDVLIEDLGFKGAISSDWGSINRGPLNPALEDMSVKDRFAMNINAGVDQFGRETTPEIVVELVNDGRISRERIDDAARRLLRCHFILGLFEDPYVDPEAAANILQSEKNQNAGYQAQIKSVVLLTNDGTIPAGKGDKKPDIYISGIDSLIAAKYGNIISDTKQSQLAIIKVSTENPRFDPFTANVNSEVNIDFPQDKWSDIKKVASAGIPVIVAFNIGGSLTVLPPNLRGICKASLIVFNITDRAMLDVVFGKFSPSGKLPFELPSSMNAVREQLEDVPFDSQNPIFDFDHGITY